MTSERCYLDLRLVLFLVPGLAASVISFFLLLLHPEEEGNFIYPVKSVLSVSHPMEEWADS